MHTQNVFFMRCHTLKEHANMSAINQYLDQYFLNQTQFSLLCKIEENELQRLIHAQLIPDASYIVTPDAIIASAVFGPLAAPDTAPGSYFHPANKIWLERAQAVISAVGFEAAQQELKQLFKRNFSLALAELDTTLWHLSDCFDEDGHAIPEGLEKRSEFAWEHFLKGTFGLCVAQPISEAAIARKEILQEKLNVLSTQIAQSEMSKEELLDLRELISQFAESSMPFSPAEYPLSSRKRLVEDLRHQIATLAQI
jgi:hypothetical protein